MKKLLSLTGFLERMGEAKISLGVTYRGAVDAWECDQMQHMNVRFFGRRFCIAESAAKASLCMSPESLPAKESLNFYREVKAGTPIYIETAAVAGGKTIYHVLRFSENGQPAATLETLFHASAPGRASVQCDGSFFETARGLVETADCHYGQLSRTGLLRVANQAAAYLGLEQYRQRDVSGSLVTGTAVVGCSIEYHKPAAADEAIFAQSAFLRSGPKSISIEHRIAGKNGLLGTCITTHVFFDMRTKAALHLPNELARQADRP